MKIFKSLFILLPLIGVHLVAFAGGNNGYDRFSPVPKLVHAQPSMNLAEINPFTLYPTDYATVEFKVTHGLAQVTLSLDGQLIKSYRSGQAVEISALQSAVYEVTMVDTFGNRHQTKLLVR